jgi:hypothetical protein
VQTLLVTLVGEAADASLSRSGTRIERRASIEEGVEDDPVRPQASTDSSTGRLWTGHYRSPFQPRVRDRNPHSPAQEQTTRTERHAVPV